MTKPSQQSTVVPQRLGALAELLGIEQVNWMECFDISHTMGEQTIVSCVFFDGKKPVRAKYHRIHIRIHYT